MIDARDPETLGERLLAKRASPRGQRKKDGEYVSPLSELADEVEREDRAEQA